MTEKQLVKKAARGNKHAASLLIEAYYNDIYRYAYRRCGNTNDAMDLTQDIFISALQALPTFDPSKAAFKTWLYRIATNRVIDMQRHQGVLTFVSMNIENDMSDIGDTEQWLENSVLAGDINAFVLKMDKECARIFHLRFYMDLTFDDIANALQMPAATIKTKYYRMIKRVREEYDGEY